MSNLHSKLEQTGPFDAVIVGAGFAGMYMLHRLRRMGLSARVSSRPAVVLVAPGIGTATQAHAAT